MSRGPTHHLALQPEALKFIDDKINELILKHHPTTGMVMHMLREFAVIVSLEYSWRPLISKYGKECKCNEYSNQ
jgi:hypothetical protein